MYYLSDRTIRNATSFPSLLSSVSPSGRPLSLQQMKDTNTREEGLRDKGGTKVRNRGNRGNFPEDRAVSFTLAAVQTYAN